MPISPQHGKARTLSQTEQLLSYWVHCTDHGTHLGTNDVKKIILHSLIRFDSAIDVRQQLNVCRQLLFVFFQNMELGVLQVYQGVSGRLQNGLSLGALAYLCIIQLLL